MPESRLSLQAVGRLARWLRAHPLTTTAGVAATAFGFINGGYTFAETVTKVVGIPRCLSYAEIYHHAAGHFDKVGAQWVEHPPYDGLNHFRFDESHRDRDYIYLLNLTPRAGGRKDMLVRLPACGGTAQWTYQNPQQWTDLYTVWR